MSEVIIVSRSPQFRNKCARMLAEERLQWSFAGSPEELTRQLRSRKVGLVIVKSGRTESECHQVLDLIKDQSPSVSVILSADYFNFWSDFSTWVADACVVESKDMAELRSAVQDLTVLSNSAADDSEDFPVDWT